MNDIIEQRKNIINKLKIVGRRLSLYLSLVLIGTVISSYYFINMATPSMIKVFKAGEVSVSISERNELIFINRDVGKPVMVDSTLTAIINNMLAAQEYLRVNIIDKRMTQVVN